MFMPSTFFVLQWSYVNKETHSPVLAGVTETIEIDDRHFAHEPQANPLLSICSLPLVSWYPYHSLAALTAICLGRCGRRPSWVFNQILEIPSMKLSVEAGKPRKMFEIMHYLC